MIYSHTEEIILLYSSDGRATLHEPHTMKGTPTTVANLERWLKWHDIIAEAEDNPSLSIALDHAETIYDLIRDSR